MKKLKLALLIAGTSLATAIPVVAICQATDLFQDGYFQRGPNGSSYATFTDSETGCQYIQRWTSGGVSVVPRMNSHGVPMCANTGK